MSYLVFARKWRPLTFDDVIGQEHITATLKKAIEKNRVAHAYIFSGTRGVGKTTTARILARALNCDNGPTITPCGTCATCKNILSGASFDVLEIDGASNNGVDDIRELRENVSYSAMGGKYRIFVIDEVHMLSKAAFNALLKTLEEPPPNVIFIFATTEPNKIPATIHSRCQRYDFRRIPVDQIQKRLAYICTQEQVPFEAAALRLVARKAEGSMRDSLSLLDQVYSFCHETINEAEVRSVLGVVDTERFAQIIDCIQSHDVKPVLQMVEDVLYAGYDLQEFLVGFEEYLRNLLFAKIPRMMQDSTIDLLREHADRIMAQAAEFSEGTLLRVAEMVKKTQSELRYSIYPRFLVECTLIKIVNIENSVTIEEILAAIKSGGALQGAKPQSIPATPMVQSAPELKKKLESAPAIVPAAPQPAPAPDDEPLPDPDYSAPDSGTSGSQNPAALWPAFLEVLLRDRPNLGSFMSHCIVAASTDHSIDLRFGDSYKFQFNEVTRHQQRDEIQKRLNAFAARPIEMHITIESPSAADTGAADSSMQGGKARLSIDDDIENEPIIKTVLDVFNGEVIG